MFTQHLYDATDRASLNAIDRFESNVRVFAKIIGLTCILFFQVEMTGDVQTFRRLVLQTLK